MELSTRPYANAGMALTTATAIAFAPMALHNPPSVHLPLPHITAPNIALTAQITSADIKALVANLDAALGAATDTVSTVAGVPGQTVVQALTTATSLNDNLWNGLISATANPALANVLTALRKTISGALTQLSKTVAPLNSDITLTTEQLGTLLTSVVTGWVGTAGQTVANLVTNPLAVSSYTGLLTAPLDMAGLGLINVITAADNLGANGLSAVHTVVTGITAQISNALSGVENLVGSVADLTGSSLVTGITTALQGIVSAPVTAVLAGVDGISNTAVTAAKQALDDVSDGARGLVKVWLGNGTSGGAIQGVLNTIGSAPLDVASYAHAVSIAVGAAINTGTVVLHTAGSMVSIPFTAGANLTTTAANVITSFVSGMAKASSGLLTAFGLGAVSGVPYAVATVVNGAVNLAATVTAAGFNTIAAALNAGSAITGALTAAAAVATPKTLAAAAAPKTVAATTPSSSSAKTGSATTSPAGTKEPEKTETPAASTTDTAAAHSTKTAQAENTTAATTKAETKEPSGTTAPAATSTTEGAKTNTTKTAGTDAAKTATSKSGAKEPAATSGTATRAASASDTGGKHRKADSDSPSPAGSTDSAGGKHRAPSAGPSGGHDGASDHAKAASGGHGGGAGH